MATKAPAKAAAAPAAAEAPAKKSKGKMILLIALPLVLLLGGGAAWYFLGHKAGDANATDAKAKAKVAAPPVFFPMEAFTVNLQPGEGAEQFLQVTLTVQAADQAQVEILKQYLPRARSRLLLLLSSKKAADILTVEGKKKLTDEIIAQLRLPFMPNGEPQDVSDVLITSFVVQ